MKIVPLILLSIVMSIGVFAQSNLSLDYFLPKDVQYNAAIPAPSAIIGHQVGEWHVTHDKLVMYMKAVAAACPSRVKLEVTGTTYEGRQQLLLIISSPENLAKLEDIRKEHLMLSDPKKSAEVTMSKMPAVVLMGYSIHGNESSGSNAALLAVYHLAAAQGVAIEALLKNTVVLVDPSFNPDGLNRFATWANQHKSKNVVTDPNSREYNEVWPGGRFNHYWFDLNRDWLPAVHVESQNRLRYYHAWRPNVITDHHEMGSNSTFFFQPGVPSRVNPLTPLRNQELTAEIAKYHARYLDKIGSLYFTKEGYDDYYYGKGSTFPDVQGSIGILFEQASSRGHAQETDNGLLTFAFTIRNQFTTTLSTLEAVRNLRLPLLEYQKEFYKSAAVEAQTTAVKGYVFGDIYNSYATETLLTMLKRHQIEVFSLLKDATVANTKFEKEKAYVVKTDQPQYRLIRSIFEKQLQYKDSLFYDVTAWTIPLALGLPYTELTAAQLAALEMGNNTDLSLVVGFNGSVEDYGWLLDWRAFQAPAALYALETEGVLCRVATNTFSTIIGGKLVEFPRGTILIPSQLQTKSKADLVGLLSKTAQQYKVSIQGVTSGNAQLGSDFGSGKMIPVSKPTIALLVGAGVSATDAGEVWHLMDQRYNVPVTQLEATTFNRVDVSKYTTIIMVSGAPIGINKDKLKLWVQGGGVLVACEDAVEWCANNGISTVGFKKPSPALDSSKHALYADKEQVDGAQRMNGAIFRAVLDPTHPLCYGYQQPFVDLFKTNTVFIKPPANPFAAPVYYEKGALQSGYATRQNLEGLQGSVSVLVQTVGSGRVIHLADNPNFRAFWLGGMRLFANAIFFGKIIEAGSARADDNN